MQAQQLEVKILADPGADVAAELLIPVFHRWIREHRLGQEQLLIDVADYSHVPGGPGVMIVGDGLQYRFDRGGGRPGLLFARKRDPIGPLAGKLLAAVGDALRAARALEQEPTLGGKLRFGGAELEVTIMSRLVASSDTETYAAFESELRAFFARLYGAGAEVTLERRGDDRAPLSATIRASEAPGLEALIAAL